MTVEAAIICFLTVWLAVVAMFGIALEKAQGKLGWTSVKLRLPKKTGKYWVCYQGGGQGIEHYDAKQKAFGVWSTCFYFDKDDEDEYFEPIYCVAAWRELPPDYCEEDK